MTAHHAPPRHGLQRLRSLLATTTLCLGTVLAQSAFAQVPQEGKPGPDGNRGHVSKLLHNPKVIAHLGLSDAQIQAARDASNTVLERHRSDFERALDPKTRTGRGAAVPVFVAVELNTLDALEGILSQAQLTRLRQIELQSFSALRALGRTVVADYLGLTDAQKQTLQTIRDDAGAKTRANFQSKTLSATEKSAANQDIQRVALQNMQQHLSAEQWVKWELLTGARFAF